MRALAELTFDYIWLMMFGSDSQIDADYSVKLLEQLPLILPTFTRQEQDALAAVARDTKARLLAEPDEHGYTPRSLITKEQKAFLESMINKDFFNNEFGGN